MNKEWLDTLRANKTIDVEGYRYRLQDFGDYGEIRKISLDRLDEVKDIWDWEFVEKVKLEDQSNWEDGAISLDGGRTFLDAEEAIGEIRRRRLWDYLLEEMDEEIRDIVEEQEPEDELEFLNLYLHIAKDDLIVG